MGYGISASGFTRPRLADIKTNLESSFLNTFGKDFDIDPDAPGGQLIGIISEREDLIWQGLEDVYNSQYPDTAFGVSLDNVRAISGIPRKGALASIIHNVRLFGTAGSPILAGTQFSVQNAPGSIFATNTDVTLVAGQDTIQSLLFSAVPDAGQWFISWFGKTTSALAFNSTAADIQAAVIAANTFATGLIVTGDYSAGFTFHFTGAAGKQQWDALTVSESTLSNGGNAVSDSVSITQGGQNQATIDCTATVTGPILANAGTLSVIVTPISGLDSVINVIDAVVGRDNESDNDYRARSAEELQIAGAGTVEAIRSGLLSLTDVTAVIVFENNTEVTDISGRPSKSFEAVVQGGNDQEIIDKLWEIKPAGIRSYGSTSGTATDSMGQPHTISFSRPTDKPIYVALTIHKNSKFPSNGAAVAAQNIVTSGSALGIGKEVVVNPYLMASLANIPGIDSLTFFIGLAADPLTSDTIPMAINEVSEWDTIRVQVTVI